MLRTAKNLISEGNWIDNELEGIGKIIYPNGDIFTGVFKAGKREGPGRFFVKSNRDVIEAEWQNDMKEGKGKIQSLNGRIRICEWKCDKQVGH